MPTPHKKRTIASFAETSILLRMPALGQKLPRRTTLPDTHLDQRDKSRVMAAIKSLSVNGFLRTGRSS